MTSSISKCTVILLWKSTHINTKELPYSLFILLVRECFSTNIVSGWTWAVPSVILLPRFSLLVQLFQLLCILNCILERTIQTLRKMFLTSQSSCPHLMTIQYQLLQLQPPLYLMLKWMRHHLTRNLHIFFLLSDRFETHNVNYSQFISTCINLHIQAFISDSQSNIQDPSTSDDLDKTVPMDVTNNSEIEHVSLLDTPEEIVNNVASSVNGTNNGNNEGILFY